MIILGLGSNVGDRLKNLRDACKLINQLETTSVLQVSPIYHSDALMLENAPNEWNKAFLNCAIAIKTSLEPLALLHALQKIEHALGRASKREKWSPRSIDIDILAFHDLQISNEKLTLPHSHLLERPFSLWPLADIAPLWIHPIAKQTAAELIEQWDSRFTGKAPLHTRQINQRIDTPQLMGILNITPDSFSDGGQFNTVANGLKQALKLVEDGAEIIDIGAESTPAASSITPEIEWQRIEPILHAISASKSEFFLAPKISIDTRHAYVAQKALNLGADIINDVSGLDHPAMREIVSAAQSECIVMHHMSIPERRDHVLPHNQDPVELTYRWAEKRLTELSQAGIPLEKIIFDPGIGFGKLAEQSFAVLKQLDRFQNLGTRILIGHSRKTFLGLFTDKPFADRDVETVALTLELAKQPIDYLRVHNVAMSARGLRVIKALTG